MTRLTSVENHNRQNLTCVRIQIPHERFTGHHTAASRPIQGYTHFSHQEASGKVDTRLQETWDQAHQRPVSAKEIAPSDGKSGPRPAGGYPECRADAHP